jgi:RHH-type proline utilization regulon transcriptional repressor/proline dehydrogenase/delta 1-pyrroline-5-carboxylate dehydrogenase
MRHLTADPQVKAALFRLVDVRPACADARDLGEHLAALLDDVEDPAGPVRAAQRLGQGRLSAAATGRVLATGVGQMAGRFIVGEDAARSVPALEKLWRSGVATTVDLLGEATVTADEADRYAARCEAALEVLCAAAVAWPANPVLEADGAGPIPRVNLSVKISALTPHLRPDAPQRAVADASARLRPLLRKARDLGAHLHIDMESLDDREAVLETALSLLEEPEFRQGPSAGIVLQAYLKESPEHLEAILGRVRRADRAVPLTIRLVKGAYWDHELVHAQQLGWDVPVWEDRAACDRCFELLTKRLLEAFPLVRPAIASHNLRSVAHALTIQEELGLDVRDVEYQVLRGLGDDLQRALADRGMRVRTYCPVGDLVAGMAYLVRRLLENSSNDSFLRARAEGHDLDSLLTAP